jgi:hypothetical protein
MAAIGANAPAAPGAPQSKVPPTGCATAAPDAPQSKEPPIGSSAAAAPSAPKPKVPQPPQPDASVSKHRPPAARAPPGSTTKSAHTTGVVSTTAGLSSQPPMHFAGATSKQSRSAQPGAPPPPLGWQTRRSQPRPPPPKQQLGLAKPASGWGWLARSAGAGGIRAGGPPPPPDRIQGRGWAVGLAEAQRRDRQDVLSISVHNTRPPAPPPPTLGSKSKSSGSASAFSRAVPIVAWPKVVQAQTAQLTQPSPGSDSTDVSVGDGQNLSPVSPQQQPGLAQDQDLDGGKGTVRNAGASAGIRAEGPPPRRMGWAVGLAEAQRRKRERDINSSPGAKDGPMGGASAAGGGAQAADSTMI